MSKKVESSMSSREPDKLCIFADIMLKESTLSRLKSPADKNVVTPITHHEDEEMCVDTRQGNISE